MDELKLKTEGVIPVHKQEFGRYTREICGKCGGSGLNDELAQCSFCAGTGKVIREVIGVLRIYPDLERKAS